MIVMGGPWAVPSTQEVIWDWAYPHWKHHNLNEFTQFSRDLADEHHTLQEGFEWYQSASWPSSSSDTSQAPWSSEEQTVDHWPLAQCLPPVTPPIQIHLTLQGQQALGFLLRFSSMMSPFLISSYTVVFIKDTNLGSPSFICNFSQFSISFYCCLWGKVINEKGINIENNLNFYTKGSSFPLPSITSYWIMRLGRGTSENWDWIQNLWAWSSRANKRHSNDDATDCQPRQVTAQRQDVSSM